MKSNLWIILIAVLNINCEDKFPQAEIIDYIPVRVIWQGDYQIDGCGFFVKIDSVEYKPINESFFDSTFQTLNDTLVEMKYKDLRREITSQCGEGYPYQIRGIEVIDIR